VRDHPRDVDPEEELLGLDAGEVRDGALGELARYGPLVVDEVGAEVDVTGAGEVDLEGARGLVKAVGGHGVRDEPLREAVLGEQVVRRAVQRRGGRRGRDGGGEGEEKDAAEQWRHGRCGFGIFFFSFSFLVLASVLRSCSLGCGRIG